MRERPRPSENAVPRKCELSPLLGREDLLTAKVDIRVVSCFSFYEGFVRFEILNRQVMQ